MSMDAAVAASVSGHPWSEAQWWAEFTTALGSGELSADQARSHAMYAPTVEMTQRALAAIDGGGSGTPPGMRGRIMSRDGLNNLPEPMPQIANTLDQRTTAMLVGSRSTGKTFLALDWSMCVATGKPWQGRATEQGPVLYVAAEGAYGLAQRVEAWEYAWGRNVADFDVLPEPVQLLDSGAVNELAAIVRESRYRLVVLDTLARCAVGGDENSARDMGIVIDSLYRIRDGNPTTVLLVHHTGKDRETTRGSSALEAGVDTVYLAEGDPRLITLTRTKRKEGPCDDRHQLALEAHGDSVVVVSTRGGQDHFLSDSADKLLSAYLSAFSETGASKAELRAASGLAPATFHRALNALLRAGALRNTGSDSRPHYISDGACQS